jgi:hypothetical protein
MGKLIRLRIRIVIWQEKYRYFRSHLNSGEVAYMYYVLYLLSLEETNHNKWESMRGENLFECDIVKRTSRRIERQQSPFYMSMMYIKKL